MGGVGEAVPPPARLPLEVLDTLPHTVAVKEVEGVVVGEEVWDWVAVEDREGEEEEEGVLESPKEGVKEAETLPAPPPPLSPPQLLGDTEPLIEGAVVFEGKGEWDRGEESEAEGEEDRVPFTVPLTKGVPVDPPLKVPSELREAQGLWEGEGVPLTLLPPLPLPGADTVGAGGEGEVERERDGEGV